MQITSQFGLSSQVHAPSGRRVALQNEGLGSSLQHYTEHVEKEVAKEWNIPETWSMTG